MISGDFEQKIMCMAKAERMLGWTQKLVRPIEADLACDITLELLQQNPESAEQN